jgi:predicted RNase H-like HicB family nuclease
MRRAEVEIYSDASNAAILRHPERRFPGCLIQGDSLSELLQSLERVARESGALSEDAAADLADVVEALEEKLAHYKATLLAHGIELPFNEKHDG